MPDTSTSTSTSTNARRDICTEGCQGGYGEEIEQPGTRYECVLLSSNLLIECQSHIALAQELAADR
jgi:hypothetical protein